MYEAIQKDAELDSLKKYDQLRARHFGLMYSTFGTISTEVYGASFSFFYGDGFVLNGLAMNLIRNQYAKVKGVELGLINEAGRVRGLQLGLINKTVELKGVQIGLWNVNEKRKFPFINW